LIFIPKALLASFFPAIFALLDLLHLPQKNNGPSLREPRDAAFLDKDGKFHLTQYKLTLYGSLCSTDSFRHNLAIALYLLGQSEGSSGKLINSNA